MRSILTASRINCVLACLRRHYWRYEVGLQKVVSAPALRFGSAWHRAMEARWQQAGYDDALAAALPGGVDLDEQHGITLATVLAAYYMPSYFQWINQRTRRA